MLFQNFIDTAFRYLLLLVMVVCSLLLQGQQNLEYEFVGALKLNDSSIITYKLNFTRIDNNKISGFSTTDFFGSQKTKTKIEGEWDVAKKRISFSETRNILSSSDAKNEDFCFVSVKNARVKTVAGKNLIAGNFTGTLPNDSNCAKGSFQLIGKDLLIRGKRKDSLHEITTNKPLILESGKEHSINWRSDTIEIEIVDALNADDDRISIYLNNDILLENYSANTQVKKISVPFDNDKCTLKIVAISEGIKPPNTVKVTLIDGAINETLSTKLNKGESAAVVLKRVKK